MKVAVVLLADTETKGDMGRMANALATVQDFKQSGDDVQLILDGAGVRWIGELEKPDHKYHDVYAEVKDRLGGVCRYCADAFGVADQVEASDATFADDFKGHPSFRSLMADGYQVITF